jgi:hypothetical protein
MDPESSSFSTADYSFHQDPPDNNIFEVDNNSPNINKPSTSNISKNNSWNSLRTLGTPYLQLHFTDEGVLIEIEFDVGATPPCTNLPVFLRRGQSMTLDSIGSFNLEDTFVYPIPTDPLEKIALKECKIRENHNFPYSKYPFREEQQHFQFYRTIKFNHPYKFYVFWDSDAQEKCFEIGCISRILNHHARADCPSSTYQKTLW